MRPIAELLDFLNHKMSMMTVYQPAVILHLLSRNGVAGRADLARMLSGYDDWNLQAWDRVLMKNPKLVLVERHEILNYDSQRQTFSLNFDLSDRAVIAQAETICQDKINEWIQKAFQSQRIDEAEAMRLYRVLEVARRSDQYHIPEVDYQLEEFAIYVAIRELHQRYPGAKVTQQPHDSPGFDLLVGTLAEPIVFVKVKATEALQPVFFLSEGERRFSIDRAEQFALALVYGIELAKEQYQLIFQTGAILPDKFGLAALQWKAEWLPSEAKNKSL